MILFNKTDMEAAKQANYTGRYYDAAFLLS